MFFDIQNEDEISLKEYGKTILLLSEITQKTNIKIIKTIILSNNLFDLYYKTRYVSDDLIDSATALLKRIGIMEEDQIFIGISVFQECLIPNTYFCISNNFTNIKYAITKLYEAWFDDKPLAYRISHKLIKENTYPAIYIQPAISKDKYFSVITRNPVNGSILCSDNYMNNVHCKFPKYNMKIQDMIIDIDKIFAVHRKICFTFDEEGKVNIIKLKEYPITKKAYFKMLIEKHKNNCISSEEFLLSINTDDLVIFNGYTFNTSSMYKQSLNLSSGIAAGYAVFTSTNLDELIKRGNQGPYILITQEISPEDINLLMQCRGAIISRGGMTSHGAVICRGFRIPAIADMKFQIDSENRVAYAQGNKIQEGDFIGICAFDESGWSLEGEIVSKYKSQVDNESCKYLIGVLHEYDDINKFSGQDIEFQRHYAEIKQALYKAGVKNEDIAG